MKAAVGGEWDAVKALVSGKADVNAADSSGRVSCAVTRLASLSRFLQRVLNVVVESAPPGMLELRKIGPRSVADQTPGRPIRSACRQAHGEE